MKKQYFLSKALFSALLVLTACGTDEEIEIDTPPTPDDDPVEQVISLQISSAGDGLTTRAVRPVYSSQADNEVDKVQLILYNSTDGTTWTKVENPVENGNYLDEDLIEWTYKETGDGIPGTDEHYSSTTIMVKNLKKLSGRHFLLQAYGYKEENKEMYTLSDSETTPGTWTYTQKEGQPVEELFAGSLQFEVNEDGKIDSDLEIGGGVPESRTLTLTRQVAGVLAYFKNIPARYEEKAVTYVKVIASASSHAFTFPNDPEERQNQVATAENGTDIELFSFDLSEYEDEDGDGVYDIEQRIGECTTVENSLLAGTFLIPFSQQEDFTFKVTLNDSEGNMLRTWNVTKEGSILYPVNRNQFYSIGFKAADNTTTGDTDDPNDDDDPIDLSVDNEIVITVLDNWDAIYDLELGGMTDHQ